MKEQSRRKGNIISFRMSDEEREMVQRIMDSRNKKASWVMREAFNLFSEQWKMSRRLETPVRN